MTPVKAYVICATPRSGSTLLCRLLAATGGAGRPDSFFRPEDIKDWADHWGLPPADPSAAPTFDRRFVEAMLHEGRAGGAVFGLRLMAENIGDAAACLDRLHPGLADDAARFQAAFGRTRYIHLTRRDRVAQAVSYVKAWQSGLWHMAPDGTEVERLAPPQTPTYDRAAIARHVAALTKHETDWQRWFDQQNIAPLRLTYEILAASPQDSLAEVLRHIGIDPALSAGIRPAVARMADRVSGDWIARYLTEPRAQ